MWKQLCQSKIVSVLVAGPQLWSELDVQERDKHKPTGSPQIKQRRSEGRSISTEPNSGSKWAVTEQGKQQHTVAQNTPSLGWLLGKKHLHCRWSLFRTDLNRFLP